MLAILDYHQAMANLTRHTLIGCVVFIACISLSHGLWREGSLASEGLQQQALLGTEEGNFAWSSVNDRAEVSFTMWMCMLTRVQITPSTQLDYTPCYDGLQCARLDVPLNWNATGEAREKRAAIAIVKCPAKVPITHEQYGGIVVVNPGKCPGACFSYHVSLTSAKVGLARVEWMRY